LHARLAESGVSEYRRPPLPKRPRSQIALMRHQLISRVEFGSIYLNALCRRMR